MSKMIKYIDGNMVTYEILKLVDEYDPILKERAKEVSFDGSVDVAYYAISIAESLGKYEGLGLAAPQVGIPYRIIALNAGDKIWVMINPVILEVAGVPVQRLEGCLSFPGLFLKISRNDKIKVKFQAVGGQEITQEFDGLTATVIQHEIDHLDGVCFTSKVSKHSLQNAKDKIKKNLRRMRDMKKLAEAQAKLTETG